MMEVRPCLIRSMTNVHEYSKAIFHGFTIRSYPDSRPARADHQKLQVTCPVAIVEYEDGKVYDVDVRRVRFIDSDTIFSQIHWDQKEGEWL